jgi:hypothetical protein
MKRMMNALSKKQDNLDSLLRIGDTVAIADDEFVESSPESAPFHLWGCPQGWKAPVAPTDWDTPERKKRWGEPELEAVNNPGKWSSFTYRP